MDNTAPKPQGYVAQSMFRSATYSRAATARLALSEQARVLADGAAVLVPITPGAHPREGALVENAARLVEEAQRLLTLAVICERIQDVSWERIGLALGNAGRKTVSRQAAHERYANPEREFHERFLRAWLLPDRAGETLATADHLAEVIAHLNAWVDGRQEGDERPIGVSLTPMSMAERCALATQAESLLRTMPVNSDAGAQEHRDLEIGLCRRKIELYEDMAAQTPGDSSAIQALADVRTRLSELLANNS